MIHRSPAARVLIVVNEDWYFWLHWCDLMEHVRREGFEVLVATRVVGEEGRRIEERGFRLIPIGLDRSSRHPIRELRSLVELARLYRRLRPDIVMHVSLKPILYGSVSARMAGVRHVVNVFAGLGYLFTDPARWTVRLPVGILLRWALAWSRSYVFFHNREDRQLLVEGGWVHPSRSAVLPGVGVDVARFTPRPEPENGPPLVLLPSRMLWDKGVGEFVAAAECLEAKGMGARWALAGRVDPGNPSAIPEEQLREWHRTGPVEWWGHLEDMPRALSDAHVVVLPSYREGLPTVLLEACACGRPIVATDVPGCREVVRHGENGFLVPPRDPQALVDAIALLIGDRGLRTGMGRKAREIVVREFSVEKIRDELVGCFRKVLAE